MHERRHREGTCSLLTPLSSPPSLGKEPGLFDLVIINDDLEKAYSELKEVLQEVSGSGLFSRAPRAGMTSRLSR